MGLPEVLETDYEDENHFGLVGPKKVLRFVCNLVVPQNGVCVCVFLRSQMSRHLGSFAKGKRQRIFYSGTCCTV